MRTLLRWAVVAWTLGLFASASAWASVVAYTDLGAFSAATVSLVTEDFEAGPWASTGDKPQGTSNLGLTWTSADILLITTVVSVSSKNSLSDVNGAPDSVDLIRTELPGGITAVGAFVGTFGQSHTVTLTAFGAGNTALGSITSPSTTFFGMPFAGLVSSVPIASVEFLADPGDGDDFAIDDFSFGAAAFVVPEPTSSLLLGLGLAGLGLLARTRP